MNRGDIIYFVYKEELRIGKIIEETSGKKIKVLTYINQAIDLEFARSELYSSFKEGDKYFQALYPGVELDLDKLMGVVLFLQTQVENT